jgi:hypothetical protein
VEGEGKTAAAGPGSPEPDRKYLKKNDIFQLDDDIRAPADGRLGGPVTLPAAGISVVAELSPLGHTRCFSGSSPVHSGPGDVINDPIPGELSVFAKKFALTA